MKKVMLILTLPALITLILCVKNSGIKIYRVLSDSMENEIKKYSFVISMPADVYKVGDIITYKTSQNPKVITHRITKINKIDGNFLFNTKGDKNNEDDPNPVSEKEIVGKLVYVFPNLNMTGSENSFYIIIFVLNTLIMGFVSGKIARILHKE